MRRFLVLATIVTVVSTAAATSAAAASGAAPARAASGAAAAGPTLSVSSNLSNRRYAASGDRAYELGTEDRKSVV